MLLVRQQWLQLRCTHTFAQSLMQLVVLYLDVMLFAVTPQQPMQAHTSQQHSLHYWFPHLSFYRPRLLDPLRIILQIVWLVFFLHHEKQAATAPRAQQMRHLSRRAVQGVGSTAKRWWGWFKSHVVLGTASGLIGSFGAVSHYTWLNTTIVRIALTIGATLLVAFTISLPMDSGSQMMMLLFFWAVALWVRDVNKRSALLLMVVLSILVSTRYLYWRVTQTINWDVPVDTLLSLVLLFAELYAWTILVLGYIQTVWPLQRKVASLPAAVESWPSVDVFIPTYNEPLHVVRPAVQAALAMDWPDDKLHVYLLDDGSRSEFAMFAERTGIQYIARADNSHAKAGNLNHALKQTDSDYISIFDCDHIPARSFLQLAMGWFGKDDKLALLQTPHHFFSPDPFEKNLTVFRNKPNEGELFYGLIQDGNDMWNASFFCGSCAVLKRGPLEEIGGIAVETVTEDAHTALKLHRRGYNSAYLNIPQAAGLATESLSAHIGQRMRWARGMAQIFRLDNPLRGQGLSLAQRICYANAMLYFLNGVPRMIYMLAPLAFLLLSSYIVFAPAIMIALYALPHIIHSYLTSSRTQGKYRHSFWAEMYETVLAWYILKPTTVALFFPEKGKFNVTAKGGVTEESYFDWGLSRPYLILVLLCLVGFMAGLWRLVYGPSDESMTVILNLLWITYNLVILGGAVAVAEEARQVRSSHRIKVDRPATIVTASEHLYSAQLLDYSDLGAGLRLPRHCLLEAGDRIKLIMADGITEVAVDAEVLNRRADLVGLRFEFADNTQEQAMLRATFARADAWVGWRMDEIPDRPLASFREVIGIGLSGYRRIVKRFVPVLLPLFNYIDRVWLVVQSVLPCTPGYKEEINAEE